MSVTATQRRLDLATALASQLAKATGFGVTPTVDGRVLVYAPRKQGHDALTLIKTEIRLTGRTAILAQVADPRLAVIEVSGA